MRGDRERGRDSERGDSEEGGARRRRRRRRGGRRGEREEGGSRYADEARGGVEDVGGDQDASDTHEHGGGEYVQEPHDHEHHAGREHHAESGGEGGEERARERGGRSRRRGRRGGRRGRDRNGERGGEAHAGNGGSEPHVGDEQPAYFSAGEDSQSGLPDVEAERPRRQRTAEPAFAETHTGSNGEVHPAKEVHRAREDVHPAKEAPSAPAVEAKPPPAPRRRSGSSEPRLERIVVGEQIEVSTEEASASSAPARKGWWQRKLGGE